MRSDSTLLTLYLLAYISENNIIHSTRDLKWPSSGVHVPWFRRARFNSLGSVHIVSFVAMEDFISSIRRMTGQVRCLWLALESFAWDELGRSFTAKLQSRRHTSRTPCWYLLKCSVVCVLVEHVRLRAPLWAILCRHTFVSVTHVFLQLEHQFLRDSRVTIVFCVRHWRLVWVAHV